MKVEKISHVPSFIKHEPRPKQQNNKQRDKKTISSKTNADQSIKIKNSNFIGWA